MIATSEQIAYLKSTINNVPDFPGPGILFRDITSMVGDPKAFALSVDLITTHFLSRRINKVDGTEARGFLFGASVALGLGVGFVVVRKSGKLPGKVLSEGYQLEYGHDSLELQQGAIKPGEKVLIVDDLLATGGTIEATAKLIRRAGGIVSHAAFVINLYDLDGEIRLKNLGIESYSLINFPGH